MRPRFGECELIRRNEWVQKVTNAGEGVWVVVHLFKEYVSPCVVLQQCLDELAGKYPNSKFVKIISTEAIPTYPDVMLPTLIIYKDGQKVTDFVGLEIFGKINNPEEIALKLNEVGPICGGDEDTKQMVKKMVERAVEQRHDDEDSDFDD